MSARIAILIGILELELFVVFLLDMIEHIVCFCDHPLIRCQLFCCACDAHQVMFC
uniref:Uncharacterized protein n=1 Tax=Arundo donax TaxID=35708 RepID=A0A0A9EYJ2_ARUDO